MLSGDTYLWVEVLHVLAIISWMAGLLYLPRLFVYHAGVAAGSEASELFKVMERRLMNGIMIPAMVVSWILGLLMGYSNALFSEPWFHAKLALAVVLTLVHIFLMRCRSDFAADRNYRSGVFYRVLNEVPTVLMIGIVILVVLKPF
jgi:putative membrane protein